MTKNDEVHSFGVREGHVIIGPHAGEQFIGMSSERIKTHVEIKGETLRITLYRGRTGRKLFGKLILPFRVEDTTRASESIYDEERELWKMVEDKDGQVRDAIDIIRGFGPGGGLIFIKSDENTHDVKWPKERQKPVQQEGE